VHVLPHWFLFFFYEHYPLTYMLAALPFMFVLALLLLRLPRMHARLLSPSPQPRFLVQLADAVTPKKLSNKRRHATSEKKMQQAQRNLSPRSRNRREKFARAIRWLDWLLHDKLRWLPSTENGRTLNGLAVMFAAWLVAAMYRWFYVNNYRRAMTVIRFGTELATPQEQLQFLISSLFALVIVAAIASPFFLLKKNREVYLDIFAVFFLWQTAYQKLRCWYFHCCFGLPSNWGIYNRFVDTLVLPTQVVEFVVGVALTLLCILFMTRSRFYKPGRGLSISMIFFAVPRFFWEFLRYRGEAYRRIGMDGFFFGLTIEQVVCIFTVLVAIIWWFVLPLEKKIMDRIHDTLRRACIEIYFHPRMHAKLSKWLGWHSSVATLEEER